MNIMTYKRGWRAKGKRHPCALDDAPTMFCLLDCPTIKFQQQNLESYVSFNLNIYYMILVSYPVWLSFWNSETSENFTDISYSLTLVFLSL